MSYYSQTNASATSLLVVTKKASENVISNTFWNARTIIRYADFNLRVVVIVQ